MSFRLRTATSALTATALTAIAMLPAPPAALASNHQLGIFEDDIALFANPAGTLQTMRQLGVGVVRVAVRWSELAPNSGSPTAPPGFNASDPAAYPAGTWDRFDTVVKDARADGIQVLFTVSGPAPLWATGAGQPAAGPYQQWKPSAAGYGGFVTAVGTRYSGHYRDPVTGHTLPAVGMWEIWNEPNWGEDLSPQAAPGSSTLLSPAIYRGLLNAGWNALQRTGHGRNTILVGSLSPRGHTDPGNTLASKPMIFVRSLYCVDGSYRQLRGASASAVGCPATAAASRTFRAANPALFGASGFGVHPYPFNQAPTMADSGDPNFVEFNEIPRLSSALDRLVRIYGSGKRFQIYDTEYGYETNPPNGSHNFVSPATAAVYINWAEYLSWRNPRIGSTMQFELNDPNPTQGESTFGYGGFAAGLVFYSGTPKADFYAYRMPIYLPSSSGRKGKALEVWGSVRPAVHVGGTQHAQIQLRRGARGAFRTVTSVAVGNGQGYFDVQVKFAASGAVRVAWRSPQGAWLYSRTVSIGIR